MVPERVSRKGGAFEADTNCGSYTNMEGAVVRTLAKSGELPQNVRVNDRGQISVVDVVMNVCFTKDGTLTNSARSNALTYYRRLQSEHQELTTACVSYTFPGRGQQEAPVAGKNGIRI